MDICDYLRARGIHVFDSLEEFQEAERLERLKLEASGTLIKLDEVVDPELVRRRLVAAAYPDVVVYFSMLEGIVHARIQSLDGYTAPTETRIKEAGFVNWNGLGYADNVMHVRYRLSNKHSWI